MNEAADIVPINRSKGKRRWKTLELPSKDYLHQVFRYEPETGKLFRRTDRPREHYKNEAGYNRFLKCYSGKEAGAKKYGKKTGDPLHVYVRLDEDRHMAHRIIWVMFYGEIPTDKMIDHINGDPFDNRIENLRLASSYQNQWNAKTQYRRKLDGLPKGVHMVQSRKLGIRYVAKTRFRGVDVTIGRFSTPEEASEAYKKRVAELRGEYNRNDQKADDGPNRGA